MPKYIPGHIVNECGEECDYYEDYKGYGTGSKGEKYCFIGLCWADGEHNGGHIKYLSAKCFPDWCPLKDYIPKED